MATALRSPLAESAVEGFRSEILKILDRRIEQQRDDAMKIELASVRKEVQSIE